MRTFNLFATGFMTSTTCVSLFIGEYAGALMFGLIAAIGVFSEVQARRYGESL